MREARLLRIGREIFLSALGLPLDTVDSWVIDRMTAILEEQDVQSGQTLFTAGEPAEFIYFMQDGEVRFTLDGRPSWTFRGRWVLGTFEVVLDRPSTRTAIALSDFHTMRVRAAAWVDLLEDSFQLARSAVINTARIMARLEERAEAATTPSPSRAATLPLPVPRETLGLIDLLALLLDVPMLRGAGVQALADLAGALQPVSFAAGDFIVERGVQPEHLIRVIEGEVFAERADPTVRRHYGPGDLVCATASMGRSADAWEAKAIAPTRGIAIPIEALFDLMEEHFDLVRSVIAALSASRARLLDQLADETGNVVLS